MAWRGGIWRSLVCGQVCWSMCQWAIRKAKELLAFRMSGQHTCNCEATQSKSPSHRAPAMLPSSVSDFLSADLQREGQSLWGTLLCYVHTLFMPRFTEWIIRKHSAKLWKGVRHNSTHCFYTLRFDFLAYSANFPCSSDAGTCQWWLVLLCFS